MYDRDELIKVLEEYGYVTSDIQRGRVAGDMLHFAVSILIAKKLDKLCAVNEIVYSGDGIVGEVDDTTSGGKPNEI